MIQMKGFAIATECDSSLRQCSSVNKIVDKLLTVNKYRNSDKLSCLAGTVVESVLVDVGWNNKNSLA